MSRRLLRSTARRSRRFQTKIFRFSRGEDGAPSLPGCVSEGDSREEALANIREAIELYLEPVDDDLTGKDGVEIQELVL
ncbi:MAG: type II toxin-antitoxin system HicB family antitoxin [Candidatus Acidiferrales bacterium]